MTGRDKSIEPGLIRPPTEELVTPDRPVDRDEPAVVVFEPAEVEQPKPVRPGREAADEVHVAPDLLDLVTGVPGTPAEEQAARQQRDLNHLVHQVLVVGLLVSTALMVTGVGLDLLLRRELPTVVPNVGEVVGRAVALRPSGFLALGLLVLIATPILRVVGSVVAFLYERDWRYAGITFLVLMVVLVSLVLGKG